MEVAERIPYTVVIDRCGGIVGLLFQCIERIAHSHANTSRFDHGGVVAAIAEGHRAAGVEALVAGHRQDALALVGAVGGDVGKLRMPAARDALRHTRHQHRLVVGREEGRQLQDVLLEHDVERRGLVEVLYGEHLAEDAVDVTPGVNDCHVLTSHDDEAVAPLLAVLHAGHHVVLGNGLARDHLVAHIAQRAVGGDVAVDEVLNSAQIVDDERRTTRGNIHPRTIGLSLCQREDSRCWNLVRLETHQRAVNVEE